ncbi:MAG TPA: pyridoxine 5'-phosphate synthase [Thermoanaerobaculia bacterium]|jgi:pyridoxine 5-phosphate synthase|nr:pyridoxine 5'-phosphate synthase [Thermoanaerobaculia bacterium]
MAGSKQSKQPRQQKAKLSVNVDHVATLRQARKTHYPDPVEAARIAEAAGASGITVHLRVDRRHIQDSDVERLRESVRGKLNLEMSSAEEMVRVALRTKPDQVTLVPERPEEVTTEGGLNLILYGRRIADVSERLTAEGIAVSLFIDPDPRQIQALAGLAERGVTGFEINTDAYTRAVEPEALEAELSQIAAAVEQGRAAGFHAYAGHGLRTDNVGPVAALPGMEELNIGHSIIARAVIVGMEAAVKEMLAAMGASKGR